MNKEIELKLKKLIYDKLETLWDEDDDSILSSFCFGENTLMLMTEAAANILLAGDDVRNYMRQEKIKP